MSKRLLSDWIDSYMTYTYNSEPPTMFRLWTAISTIASVLQRKCVLNWGPIRFFPNMYIVLVGPSGTRKGTAMGPGKNLLVDCGVKMAAESITREALVREIMNAKAQEILPDGTMGGMHSSLTVFAPELTVFLGYNNQQLMMDLTDWFDCGHGPDGRWTYRTKTQGSDEIIGVWVHLYGATTPDLLRSSLTLDAIGGGLTSRIVFVYEERKAKTVPAPFLTPTEIQMGKDLHRDLEEILLLRGEFKVTPEFIDYWMDWYPEQDKNPPFDDPRLNPYNERRPVHTMKLAMIMNASRTSDMIITVEDLKRAIKILTKTERKMANTFSGVGKSPYADTLTAIMNEIGMRGEITLSELQRKYYFDADARVLETIIQTLRTMGFLRQIHQGDDIILKHIKRVPNDGTGETSETDGSNSSIIM